LQVTT